MSICTLLVWREISRCSSIRRVYSSSFTPRPRSRASSCVSSIGKPYVACSVKASSPVISPLRGRLLEDLHAALERLGEALLLGGEHLRDLARCSLELRIRVAHLLDHGLGEPGQERRLHADPQPVLRGAADDAAQHVAAALVRRRDAVADEERHAAAVVGEHAVRLRRVRRVAVRDAGLRGDPRHDRLVAVGVVDRRDVLHDPRRPLEAEAGVDVLLRQRRERAVGVQLVLP